jgi:hypothetical protein
MAELDAQLVQQVLDVAKRQQELDVEHLRHADDNWARRDVSKRGAFCPRRRLAKRPTLPQAKLF